MSTADNTRPEVRRLVANIDKLGSISVLETRALLRAILGSAIGEPNWSASVSVVGAWKGRGVPPLSITWEERPVPASSS